MDEISEALYRASAVQLAMMAFNPDGPTEHSGVSEWQDLLETLWRLGLAEPLQNRDEKWTPVSSLPWEFRVTPLDEAQARMARAKVPYQAERQALFRQLFAFSKDFHPLRTDRQPDLPPYQERPFAEALADAGYMERVGPAFRWTDKIGPWMRAIGEWRDGETGDEAGRFEREARNAADRAPVGIRRRLYSGLAGSLEEDRAARDQAYRVARHWNGYRWTDEPKYAPQSAFVDQLRAYAAILECADETS